MLLVSQTGTAPTVMGMENGQYIFSLGGKKYLSKSKKIFSNDFQILENQIVPLNYDDGKRLILTKFCDGVCGDVEIVDAHNASLFNEPFLHRFSWISGEEITTCFYLLFDGPKAHITIRLKEDSFFGTWYSKPMQVYL
ncbi:MAG: hypothetical protein WC303_03800 [Candidatus Paceibacterota bacterium]|jgi:hypothetical protein